MKRQAHTKFKETSNSMAINIFQIAELVINIYLNNLNATIFLKSNHLSQDILKISGNLFEKKNHPQVDLVQLPSII